MSTYHAKGWVPDLPDQRDYTYLATPEQVQSLPSAVDLRADMPGIYDQGQLGSCTAQAVAAAMEFDRRKERLTDFIPSRLFIYYYTRVLEHTVSIDSGASLRDTTKTVARRGACPESEWPYIINRFADLPAAADRRDALQDRALLYRRVPRTLQQMQACLASGYPFYFGIAVYESFESSIVAQTGMVPLPAMDEQLLGGHALLAVGYRNSDQYFVVRNSWGTGFGDHGYLYIPYTYLLNRGLASDFWVIKTVGS